MWNILRNRSVGRKRRWKALDAATAHLVDGLEPRLVLAAPGPVEVTGVDYPNESYSAIQIHWESEPNADEYEYWISYSNLFTLQRGTTTETTLQQSSSTDLDSLLTQGYPAHKFRVWVRASNDDGFGPWSSAFDWISFGGEAPMEQPVSTVRIGSTTGWTTYYTGDNSIGLGWSANLNAQTQEYELWISTDGQRYGELRRVGERLFSPAYGEDVPGGDLPHLGPSKERTGNWPVVRTLHYWNRGSTGNHGTDWGWAFQSS